MRNQKNADTSIGQQLLTVDQVAHRLNIGIRTVWRLDKDKKLPAAKQIGRSKRWDVYDLELWLQLDCPNRNKFDKLKNERVGNDKTIRDK